MARIARHFARRVGLWAGAQYSCPSAASRRIPPSLSYFSCRTLATESTAATVVTGFSDELLMSMNMGYGISAESNEELAHQLFKNQIVKSPALLEALKKVDRRTFCPSESKECYENKPLSLGYGATISTPQHHASILQLLSNHLSPPCKNALDIGCGSGYLMAVMAEMLGPDGSVVGVEVVPELFELSKANLEAHKAGIIESGRATVRLGDASGGVPFEIAGPFDCIHVGAAAERGEEAIKAFAAHLKPGGRLIIPIGPAKSEQKLVQVDKSEDGSLQETIISSVLCQPLVPDPVRPVEESVHAKRDRLRKELKDWEMDFVAQNQHKPTRQDLFDDVKAKKLFEEFALVNKWQK